MFEMWFLYMKTSTIEEVHSTKANMIMIDFIKKEIIFRKDFKCIVQG